jgi:hypothetical protein
LFSANALADTSNLESGQPIEVSDAEPVEAGQKQLQLTSRFDRERGGDNHVLVEPQFQWGFAQRWQATLSVRGIGGSADHTGNGDIRAQVMRKLNDEAGMLPATALQLQLDLPSGRGTRGVDPTLRLIATKTLGSQFKTHQLHVNAAWMRNNSPMPGERRERAQLIVGYSTPLTERTTLVANLVREHERERGQMASIAEIGLRQDVGSQTTLSLGAGAGRGGDSAPRWRAAAAVERSF